MNNVTHDPIFQVATGFMAAKHLFAATEIGLFEKLASGPATVDELAQRTGSPRRTLRMVADAMVALGFLERVEGQYRNSPEADLFLSGRDPTSDLRPAMRFFNLFSYRRWEKFEEAVRFDKPVFGKYEIAEGEKEYYYAGMEKITTMAAQALVAAYDFIPHRSLLDLGGGTGSFVEVILRRYTGLGATVYDRPHITSVTRRRLAPFGDRVQVVEGNFFIDPIPTGHDAVLLANIVHLFTQEQNIDLLNRIRRSVPDGARLLIVDFWTNSTHTEPLFAALMTGSFMTTSGEGDVYSTEEALSWLRQTGWRKVDHKPLTGAAGASLLVAESAG